MQDCTDQTGRQVARILSVADNMAEIQERTQPLRVLLEGSGSDTGDAELIQEDYRIDHCGLLLRPEFPEDMLERLLQTGFQILQRFPSKVLASWFPTLDVNILV